MSGGERSEAERVAARFLEWGADQAEVDAARQDGRERSLALQLLVAPDSRMTFAEASSAAGVDPDVVRRLWRAWGFPPIDPEDRRFGEDDLPVFQFAVVVEGMLGPEVAFHTSRVLGTSMSRIADAEISMLRSVIEAPLVASGADVLSVVETYRDLVMALLPTTAATLQVLHRHAMVESARRQDAVKVEPTAVSRTQTLIGFADLTGSTSLTLDRSLEELDRVLAAFEERTADVITDGGAHLVKRIGDAVMFTAPSGPIGASVALDLVDRFDDDLVPAIRVGLAYGTVVALRGDYYGPPVNLAARLIGVAKPSTVLVSADVAALLPGEDWSCASIGDVLLPGFPEPVPALQVVR